MEYFKQSEQINELAAALSEAQGEYEDPEHDGIVDFTDKTGRRVNYTYATLKAVLKKIRPVNKKYGLAVSQSVINSENGKILVVTTLMHKSGQYIRSAFGLNHGDNKPQEQGGIVTYDRRYSLAPILGISSEADTDGAEPEKEKATNKAAPQSTAKPAQKSAPVKAPPKIHANTIYNGSTEHQEEAARLLTKNGIEKELWAEIAERMENKPFNKLGEVSKYVREDFIAKGIPF